MILLRYLDDTGASSPIPMEGFLPVYEGNKPQPTQCEQIVQDTVQRMADHWVQTWKIEPAPMYSAGEWLELVGYGAGQQPTLIYLKMQLLTAGKTSAKLAATEAFIGQVLALYAANDVPRCDWEQPPYGFQEVVAECIDAIS